MSTAYPVELTDRAARDLRILLVSVRAHESSAAARWFNSLERAVKSLRQSPERCPVAPESKGKSMVRHLLYGRKPHIYRILFQVAKEEKTVYLLHIRHAARRPAIDT
ncbi:MAG TPA: type II toxin-antitoxin system RelE/ParE family toxin [Bryobacteraceae bacterium]